MIYGPPTMHEQWRAVLTQEYGSLCLGFKHRRGLFNMPPLTDVEENRMKARIIELQNLLFPEPPSYGRTFT